MLRTAALAWAAPVLVWGLFSLVPAALFAHDGDRARAAGALQTTAMFAALWGVVAAPFVVVVLLARIVGPYHLSLAALALSGPALVAGWASRTWRFGWEGAVESLSARDLLAVTLLAGLPLLRIGLGVLGRLGTVYVITDRRGAELRPGRIVWEAPLRDGRRLACRVVAPWGAGARGHLVFGIGRDRREMRLLDAPDRVLADVRAALGPA